MKYAADTNVSVERSRSEIEKTLQRYGATGFMYGWNAKGAVIAFQMRNLTVKLFLPLPDPASDEICLTPMGKRRNDQAIQRAWEQACKQRWRALALCIHAKLEAVETGITSFEEEFMAHFVMPNGEVFGSYALPQIEDASRSGKMPQLLIGN